MELNFSVTNQRIKYTSNLYIVEKSRNYLTAKFSFSGKEWKEVAKTAIFKKGDLVYNVLLDADGRCKVPAEVITSGVLKVSVFGGDLITVDTADVKIIKSGYEEGNAPSEPTPDVYAQILSELQDIRNGLVDEETIKKAVEDWLAENAVDVISPEEVERIIDEYFIKHKDELKGVDGKDGVTFTPYISEDCILSWTNNGGLENPKPVQLAAQESGGVPTTRKIADIDLTDDISKEELVASERTVKGEVYVKFANQEEVEVELPEYLPYPKDNKEGKKGQFLISNGDGSTSWVSIEMAEGGAY